jgi:hypothetical protein
MPSTMTRGMVQAQTRSVLEKAGTVSLSAEFLTLFAVRLSSRMGERDPQKQLWYYQVNLDKRVRSDHLLRQVNETPELDFVRREVAQF